MGVEYIAVVVRGRGLSKGGSAEVRRLAIGGACCRGTGAEEATRYRGSKPPGEGHRGASTSSREWASGEGGTEESVPPGVVVASGSRA